MVLADVGQRRPLIDGLRALADFLESRSEIPVPLAVDVTVFPTGTAEEMRAEIDRIAALIGSRIDSAAKSRGFYRTAIEFGPVLFRAVAVLDKARARHAGETRNRGAVNAGSSKEL